MQSQENMRNYAWVSLLLFTILFSCGKPIPELENFNAEAWKSDKNGCGGKRAEMESVLISQKGKILALSEMDIVELLGKPDENELYKRNQKFYSYYFTPSKHCAGSDSTNVRWLSVRFNAVGLAKEISVETGQ